MDKVKHTSYQGTAQPRKLADGKATQNRYIPNSFQTPNVLVDEIMPLLTPTEWVVLSFAVRHIIGWKDKIAGRKAPISMSTFKRCGLALQTIQEALEELTRYRLLKKSGKPTAKGQVWKLAFDESVDLVGLQKRADEKRQKVREHMEHARKSRGQAFYQVERSSQQNGGVLPARNIKTHSSNTKSPPLPPQGERERSLRASKANTSKPNAAVSTGLEAGPVDALQPDGLGSVCRAIAHEHGREWINPGLPRQLARQFPSGEPDIRVFAGWFCSKYPNVRNFPGPSKLPGYVDACHAERRAVVKPLRLATDPNCKICHGVGIRYYGEGLARTAAPCECQQRAE